MCGGIFVNWSRVPKKELKQFFSDSDISKMERKDGFESYFWSRQPVLPIDDGGKVHLKKWGNREKEIDLPKTGWAKKESIESGKWQYLHPRQVTIPADKGYEKGVWFDLQGSGFAGLLIEKDGHDRVYMITKEASLSYKKMTHHDREPIEVNSEN